MHTIVVNILILIHVSFAATDYWTDRHNLIEDDKNQAIGSNIILTEKERRVNDVLMKYKIQEFKEGFKDPDSFLAQKHFFNSKDIMEKSKIFNIIKDLPKGASLHSHDESMVSGEYLYNLTFIHNLYGCIKGSDLKLHFFSPENISNSCNWSLLSELREADIHFENFLKSKLTLTLYKPDELSDINSMWAAFKNIFGTVTGLITYKPVFEDYFYQALEEMYEDNVKYLEVRGFLPNVYDLEGNLYSDAEVLGFYYETLQRFKKDYPDFYGAKFIYAPSRRVDNATMSNYIKIYRQLKQHYPDFVAGFDLVGQEDLGNPLSSFIPQLMELKKLGTKFYFHAGESNWYGESTDLNLIDAILLNTTRIGHGYALLKHPAASKLVKDLKIAIEVCPISNQVLKLVSDLRNHPGAIMIANGFPVVIGADDPSFWGAKGLTYDWYLAFMAMTSKSTGLGFLKQLALNSLEYSSLQEFEKTHALSQWQKEWDLFIDKMLIKYIES